MKKTCFNLLVSMALGLLILSPAFGFGGSAMPGIGSGGSTGDSRPVNIEIKVRKQGSDQVLKIPLFSEKYAEMPVAMVADEPITLKEFSREMASMHQELKEGEAAKNQNYKDLLERLITVKLVKQEALNIGFDRTPQVQSQMDNFAVKNMIKQLVSTQLKDLRVPVSEVEELYKEMALEAKLLTFSFADKADAEKLLKEVEAGGDFKQLGDKLVAAGKAKGGEAPEYARLQDMVPSVAQAVYGMKVGDVSQVFKGAKNYYLFQVKARQVYDDPEVRQAAANRLMQQLAEKKQFEYMDGLIAKYATYNKETEAALDFVKIADEEKGVKGSEVFARLQKDKRPYVTISDGSKTQVITVADVAQKIEKSLYHGMDRALEGEKLNGDKKTVLYNELVGICGKLEAEKQGIDKSPEFIEKMQNFENRVLFDTFMAKAVVPGVKVPEDDAKKYYYNHLEDYSSPLMLKMKSLAFTDRSAAEEAYKKLQAGSDFNWVSANSTSQAAPDDKDMLNLGDTLLAATALPPDLQKIVSGAKAGRMYLYPDPGKLYYVLLVDTAFPPKAKTYQEVRQEVGRIIYGQKIKEALADWVVKLKQAYETQVFLVQGKN